MEILAMHHRGGQQIRVGNRHRPQLRRTASVFGTACRRQLVIPRPGLRTVGSGGEAIFLRACGDLTDWRALRGFQSRCEALIHAGTDRVVLDLSEVQQADTKLVACLLILLRRARNVNVRFAGSSRSPLESSEKVEKEEGLCVACFGMPQGGYPTPSAIVFMTPRDRVHASQGS